MKTLNDYLDDLKAKTGSDYKTAEALKTNRSTISCIRKRNLMSDETAIKVAEILGINPSEVLIAAAIARSEGDVKKAWTKAAERLGIAASFLLVLLSADGLSALNRALQCILC